MSSSDKLVDMLKAEEMETYSSSISASGGASRSISLVADKEGYTSLNLEDAMGMLTRNIGKMMNPSGWRNHYCRWR